MFTNRYIFIYSSVMVIIVAAILSSAAMVLKPYQERNIAIAKIQGILMAADIEASTDNAEALFSQVILEELVIDQDGNVSGRYSKGALTEGDDRAFDLKLKKELYNKKQGSPYKVPLYIAEADGEKIFIIPLLGAGLWGPIYGNISLKQDMSTIFGAEFGNDKETPGLGAEISDREFALQFLGKSIFDEQGQFASITVKKGGVETMPEAKRIHGVDAISGGTITSDAVTKMIDNCLENYVAYFKSQQ
ncbi:MAG: NADH:ubiquinone reductase (Na(+)-transporting) subunit C [Bacteroidota bacterium]